MMNWFKKIAYDQEGHIQDLSRKNPYPFKEWFDKNGRAYVPFSTAGTEMEEGVDKHVAAELVEKGYQITDYRKGYCASGNRSLRIGKVLNSLKQRALRDIQNQFQNISQEQDPVKYQIFQNRMQEETESTNNYYNELIETFINSTYRTHQSKQDSGFMIVISQDPHDVAQMSTGRQWTSCMNLGGDGEGPGSHHEDIFCEVQNGGLVAYLIRADDQEIEDPLARIHIRRFDNKSGRSVAIPEKSVYGNEIKGFQQSVQSWIDERQGDITPGAYERQGGEYSDTFGDNMLIAPSNIEDVLKWLRGEGEDAQYSTWEVFDNLFLELSENYNTYEHYETDMEDETKKFETKEEAEKYLEEMNNLRTEMEEYYREQLVERGGDAEWNEMDRETGEWEEQRFWLQEHKTDHRSSMTNDAIKTIIKAPKDTYSPEVIQEVKDMVFNSNVRNDNNRKEFLRTYPELFSNNELSGMKDTDQLSVFKKLSPEKQEQQRQSWAEYIHDTLDTPQVFINEKVQQAIRERDRTTDTNTKIRAEDSVGMFYSLALTDWLFNPLREVFKPIPEPIVQKLVNFGMNFLQEDNPMAPYEDSQKYDDEILGNMVHVLASTKSDTPTVQRFYKELLPLWKDNRETYYDKYTALNVESLGRAIGDLGENGREFLPFIQNKIVEEKQALDQLEKSITPEAQEWRTTKDLLKRAYKKIEKLYLIEKSINPENKDPMTYKWYRSYGNWYKQALRFKNHELV
jgi:hypothetical protein